MINKNISILSLLCFTSTLIGMETSLSYLMPIMPDDVKNEICHYVKPQQWWYLDQTFEHNGSVYSVCFNGGGNLLATGSDEKKARIFKKYENYTLDQLILKITLLQWLLIEKPNKAIDDLAKLFNNVAAKQTIFPKNLFLPWIQTTFSTFPHNMQNAILRTMLYKIKQYGK